MERTYQVKISCDDSSYITPGYEQDIKQFIDDDLNYDGLGRFSIEVKEVDNLNQDAYDFI